MKKLIKIRASVQRVKLQMKEVYFLVETKQPEIGEVYIDVNGEKCRLLWYYQKDGDTKLVERMVMTRRR